MFDGLNVEEAKLLSTTITASRDAIGNAYAEITLLLDAYAEVMVDYDSGKINAEEFVDGVAEALHPFVMRDIKRLLDQRVRQAIREAEPRIRAELDKTDQFD